MSNVLTQPKKNKSKPAPAVTSPAATATAKPFEENYDLPQKYGTTSLTLMSRDPHWVHAYWEVAPADVNALKVQLGSDFQKSTMTLRMHDVTKVDFNGQNANHSFDVAVDPNVDRWYVNLWRDCVDYCGEIGVTTPDGKFVPYTRSNCVATPREHPSDRCEMMWLEVKEGKKKPFVFTAQERLAALKKELAKSTYQSPARLKPTRKRYLTEKDIRDYYANLFPLLGRLKAKKKALRRAAAAKKPNVLLLNDRRLLEQRDDLFRIEDLVWPEGMSQKEFFERFLWGASAELVRKGGGSEQLQPPGASWFEHPLSKDLRSRKFFFELGTKLIVYGRTEPDAEVWWGDKKVDLRPDGTFSMRFALGDGNVPLDFVAISRDRVEQRRITTAVERKKTVYNP